MHTATLDGKHIAWHDTTVFLVQVGRGRKGAYKTSYNCGPNLARAMMYFNGINIGNGYKARVFVPSFNRPVLCRKSSA
jgi:hypothetical protein